MLGDLPTGNGDGRHAIFQLERTADPVLADHRENVIKVGRPVYAQRDSRISLFRIEPDGIHARRVQVSIGQTSVNEIEILEGLQPGDQVILSDMSAWDDHDRIRLQ